MSHLNTTNSDESLEFLWTLYMNDSCIEFIKIPTTHLSWWYWDDSSRMCNTKMPHLECGILKWDSLSGCDISRTHPRSWNSIYSSTSLWHFNHSSNMCDIEMTDPEFVTLWPHLAANFNGSRTHTRTAGSRQRCSKNPIVMTRVELVIFGWQAWSSWYPCTNAYGRGRPALRKRCSKN